MNNFIKYLLQIFIPIILLYSGAFFISINSDDVNEVFPRTVDFFTSHHNGSIIIGTSRAGQAIDPEFLTSGNFFNAAFTMSHSPFNQTYVEGIKNFTHWSDSAERLMIVEVNPWSIRTSEELTEEPKEEYFGRYDPKGGYLSLWKIFIDEIGAIKALFSLVQSRPGSITEKGRLVVNFSEEWIKKNQQKLIPRKVYAYKAKPEFRNGIVSEYRLNALKEIISYGEQHGRVVLVRFPISEEMFALENEMDPGFSDRMKELVTETDVAYLDLTIWNTEFQTTDGNHLWNPDAVRFSKQLNDTINSVY